MHTISTLKIKIEKLKARSLRLFTISILFFAGFHSQIYGQTSCPVSNEVTILVYPQPTITITGATTICAGGSTSLKATPTGGVPGACSVTWQSRIDTVSGTFANVTNTNSDPNIFITPNLSVTTQYRAILNCTEASCSAPPSNTQTVTVNPIISIVTHPQSFEECINGTTQLSVQTAGGTGSLQYQWYSGTDTTNLTIIPGETLPNYTPVATVARITYYRVIVSSAVSGCGSKSSFAAKVVVNDILAITAQTPSFEECFGGTQTLSVTIKGGVPSQTTYQWQVSPDGLTFQDSIGQTSAVITPLAANAGVRYYRVNIVSGGSNCGQQTSTPTKVTVSPQIKTVADINDITECINGTDSLNFVTSGGASNKTYIWESSKTNNASSFLPIASAQSKATFTPDPSAAGTTYYRVRVNSTYTNCTSDTSRIATVIINPAVSIRTSLAPFEECVLGGQTLFVQADGGIPSLTTYQWFVSNVSDGTGMVAVPTGTSATFKPDDTAPSVKYYKVIVTSGGSNCGQATSNIVKIKVSPQIVVLADIQDITECLNGNEKLKYVLSGGASDYTFIWESSTSGAPGTFTPVSNQPNSSTYLPDSSVVSTKYYRVRINSAVTTCSTPTSRTAKVIVNDTLAITNTLADFSECTGGTQSLTVNISGGLTNPKTTYSWLQSASAAGQFIAATGPNIGPTYIPDATKAGVTYYKVLVTSSGTNCGSQYSNAVKVTITDQINIVTAPQPIVECTNGTQTLSVKPTGGSGAYHYKWYLSNQQNGGYTPIANSDSSVYTPNSTTDGIAYYSVEITTPGVNNGCSTARSVAVSVDVRKQIAFQTDLVGFVECVTFGKDSLYISVLNGTSTNNTSNLTYQWFYSNSQNSGFTLIPNATNASYTPPSTAVGTLYYNVQITDSGSGCKALPSKTVAVTINPQVSINVPPQDINECTNGGQSLNFGYIDGAGSTFNFQWQKSTDNITFADTVGATGLSFTPPSALAGTLYYRVIVTPSGGGCQTVPSKSAKVIVSPQISVVTPPQNIDECIGGTVPLSVTVKDGSGTATYQWQTSSDQITWFNVSGETNPTYNHPPSTTAGVTFYKCLINAPNAGCGQANSGIAKVTIFAKPQLDVKAGVPAVCVDGQVQLTATKTGGTGTCVITWQVSTDNGTTFNNVPTQPTNPDSKYITPPLKANTKYHATITCSGSGCCN